MQESHSGRVAGQLYFVSTLGSALGTLATSFYFVLWMEMDTILFMLAGVLAICGALALTGAAVIGERAEPAEA